MAMMQFSLDQLPALVLECDQHPYEILGQWYGDDIPAAANNPPECHNRNLSKEVLAKAVATQIIPHKHPDSGKHIWLPGMRFDDGAYKPKCGKCGTPLKLNKDGSLVDYRCTWCGLTAFVDAEAVPHCLTCGGSLRVERQGSSKNRSFQEQAYCPGCCIRYIRTDSNQWEGYYVSIIRKGDRPE